MARYFDVHPVDPQRRAIGQIVDLIRDGGLVAYPTDSCYALGCSLSNKDALQRIRDIRKLDSKHDFTLVCRDFSQMDAYVTFDNSKLEVDEPDVESAVTLGLTFGGWVWNREVPLYIGAYGGVSPFVRDGNDLTYQFGIASGFYAPLLDFN